MKRKMFLILLMLSLMLGTVNSVYAKTGYGGYTYDFEWTYDAGTTSTTVRAFTDEPNCDKMSFRYWLGSKSGVADIIVHNVPIVVEGGFRVAYDIQADLDYCEEWYVQIHFHSLGPNGEDSEKVENGIHVPWFGSFPLAVLIAVSGITLMKRKKII